MQRNQRFTMLGLAAIVVVAAIVVIPGSDDEPDPAPVAQTASGKVETTASATDRTSTTPTTETKRKPNPPLLRAGQERELEFKKGDTVTFRVRHSTDEEIHVHGYDKSKDIRENQITTMSFKANIEGIFEVELEHSGVPLGTIKVEPK